MGIRGGVGVASVAHPLQIKREYAVMIRSENTEQKEKRSSIAARSAPRSRYMCKQKVHRGNAVMHSDRDRRLRACSTMNYEI